MIHLSVPWGHCWCVKRLGAKELYYSRLCFSVCTVYVWDRDTKWWTGERHSAGKAGNGLSSSAGQFSFGQAQRPCPTEQRSCKHHSWAEQTPVCLREGTDSIFSSSGITLIEICCWKLCTQLACWWDNANSAICGVGNEGSRWSLNRWTGMIRMRN